MKVLPAILLCVSLACFACGCAPVGSLFELYTTQDKLFDPNLIGEWKQVSPPGSEKLSRWLFQADKESVTYSAALTSLDKTGRWQADARLVNLGDFLFIDFTASSDALNDENAKVPFPSTPIHMFGRIWIEPGHVKIHFLNDDWVKAQIKAGTFPLPHVEKDGDPLLLAPTDELRKFVQEHAEDKEAFSENYELVRLD